MPYSEQTVERLAAALYQLHAAPLEPGAVARAITAALARAIECDLALLLTFSGGSVQAVAWPHGVRLPAVDAALVARHRAEHPLVRWIEGHRAISAWRLSDVADADAPPMPDFYGALPARHVLAMRLASPDRRTRAVALARGGSDFSADERRVLELTWPSIVRVLRTARHAQRYGATATAAIDKPREGRGIVQIDSGLNVEMATERARLWLGEYFPDARSPHRMALPPPVHEWARRRLDDENVGTRTPPTEREPLIRQRDERFLVIDLVVDHGRGSHLLTLAEETLVAPASSLQSLGLTTREAEVLAWVAQGKTNREIGLIVGASARTVQKHLENLFQKLGVESRTAATLKAWQVARFASFGAQ